MRRSEQRRALGLVSAATSLTLVTFVTPQATVGRTVTSFGAGPATAAWLLSAMALGLAVTLLPAGALADDRGRRRVFAGGLGLLAAGAAVCALAGEPVLFVVGRLLQGVGGGAVLPAGWAYWRTCSRKVSRGPARPGCGARASAAASRPVGS